MSSQSATTVKKYPMRKKSLYGMFSISVMKPEAEAAEVTV